MRPSSYRISVIALLIPLLQVWTAEAVVPFGDEFQINVYTTRSQKAPAVAAVNGAFVVAWDSETQDGSNKGVVARLGEGSGTSLGNEFQANTYTTGVQYMAAVAGHTDGSFVVVWASRETGADGQDGSGSGCFGQRFDAATARVGTEFQINTFTSGMQDRPAVAIASDGGFLVVWESQAQDGDGAGVYAQRFDADGTPSGTEHRVNSYTTGDQSRPVVCTKSDGEFIVIWDGKGTDPSGFGVFSRRLSAAGLPVGSDGQVNTFTFDSQSNPAVACSAGGGFVVAWESAYQDNPEATTGVFGRRFNNSAQPLTNEFGVNTYTTGAQGAAAVAQASDGRFVIAWHSTNQNGGGPFAAAVLAQAFSAAAIPLGSEFQVNSYTTGTQNDPALTFTGALSFVATWSSDTFFSPFTQDGDDAGVFARRLLVGSTTTTLMTTTTVTTSTLSTTTTATVTTTTLPATTTTTTTAITTTTLVGGFACGDANRDGSITATDALIALVTAVGADSCPACLCDTAAPRPTITATDALLILQAAVSDDLPLTCGQAC